MNDLAWLGCQYRALLIRESYLLDWMLFLSLIGRENGKRFAELELELHGLGRHQSDLARSIAQTFEFRFPAGSPN